MVEMGKTVVKKILQILPVICIVLLSVSIVMLSVSLDPGVKWNEYHKELFPNKSWKLPVRSALHQAIGLVSGTLFLLMISVITNDVIKQKLFSTITKVIALGTGISGGYLSIKAISEYKRGIPEAISMTARSLNDPVNRYYFPEKEEMQVGYNLAKYSAVTTIICCALILGNIGLYIPFGEGKWIWQKKSTVIPDT